jgi:hypothetical protein
LVRSVFQSQVRSQLLRTPAEKADFSYNSVGFLFRMCVVHKNLRTRPAEREGAGSPDAARR